MSEKTVRQLEKELAKARRIQRSEHKITQSRNLDYIGADPKTVKKEKPNMSDIPDYIGLPKKQKKRTENKW
mgnify:CR=1 FL=1|jgi:hypothetical protein|tara:strand:- start:717 stop:929 length:213 start_codon:yes stop_codon:yes gene_type:complete